LKSAALDHVNCLLSRLACTSDAFHNHVHSSQAQTPTSIHNSAPFDSKSHFCIPLRHRLSMIRNQFPTPRAASISFPKQFAQATQASQKCCSKTRQQQRTPHTCYVACCACAGAAKRMRVANFLNVLSSKLVHVIQTSHVNAPKYHHRFVRHWSSHVLADG
jgi:hypothetical protein